MMGLYSTEEQLWRNIYFKPAIYFKIISYCSVTQQQIQPHQEKNPIWNITGLLIRTY